RQASCRWENILSMTQARTAERPTIQVPDYTHNSRIDPGLESGPQASSVASGKEKEMTDLTGKPFSRDSVLGWAVSERERFEEALREMVEIPTVSSSPERKADCARGAAFAADLIRRMGGEARLIESAGNPLVHGFLARDPSWPTVT